MWLTTNDKTFWLRIDQLEKGILKNIQYTHMRQNAQNAIISP